MHNDQRVTLAFAMYEGEAFVRRISVTTDVVRIGSDPRSHIQIDAARLHALIEVASLDDITFVDLGHESGTFVNGSRARKCTLKRNDVIVIGRTRLVLEHIEHSAAERAATAMPYSPFGSSGPSAWNEEYRVVPATAPVPDDEIDAPASAVEIRFYWGTTLLEVAHRDPSRAFYVGDSSDPRLRCDWLVPSEKLGSDRAPLYLPGTAVLLPGAIGTITMPGKPAMRLDEANGSPCAELKGATVIPLRDGMTVRQQIGDVVFEIAAVRKARRAGAAFTLAALVGGASAYVLGSFVAHAGMLAALANFSPPLNGTDDDSLTDQQRITMQYFLEAAAEKEQELRQTEQITTADATDTEGGSGKRARDEEGAMGDATSRDRNKHWQLAGPPDNPDPHIGKQAAIEMAQTFGAVGLLNGGSDVDFNALTAHWGQLTAEGKDPNNYLGNMWGDLPGNAYGAGGLGLSGIGEGGGGKGEGIGLGDIGTLNHGSGNCASGPCDGFGNGTGRLSRGRRVKAPRVRMAPVSVSGRLPPEVIQRIVRQNFGRFRYCYENGLRQNPNLQGRVAVNFVIGRDGRVSNVGGGGDLPDGGVVSCVTRAFYGLSFPQPDGGIVTVSYPIVFSPGGE